MIGTITTYLIDAAAGHEKPTGLGPGSSWSTMRSTALVHDQIELKKLARSKGDCGVHGGVLVVELELMLSVQSDKGCSGAWLQSPIRTHAIFWFGGFFSQLIFFGRHDRLRTNSVTQRTARGKLCTSGFEELVIGCAEAVANEKQ